MYIIKERALSTVCTILYVLILFVDNFAQLAKYDLYKGTQIDHFTLPVTLKTV